MIAGAAGVAVVALFFWFGLPNVSPLSPSSSVAGGADAQKVEADPRLGNIDIDASSFNETESGIKVADLTVGTGLEIAEGQTITIHYVGKLADGTQFDSSVVRGQPVPFLLGSHQVIPGMEEGVKGMRVGGVRRIIIPAALAYGSEGVKDEAGNYVIPPDSTLTFDVQIVSAESGESTSNQ